MSDAAPASPSSPLRRVRPRPPRPAQLRAQFQVTFDGEDETALPLLEAKTTAFTDGGDDMPQLPEKLRQIRDQMTPAQLFATHIHAAHTSMTLQRMRKVSVQFTPIAPEDENQERGNWGNPIEFLLSSLGYVVGLGNIWRFPYLVYRNGGGAFFIPYFMMLFMCGMPMVLMELTLGQYWAQGALTVWKLSPLFKGIGFSMVILCFYCIIYYCMITGWALFYFVSSIRMQLPWACCHREWASENCMSFVQDSPMCNGTGIEGLAASTEWTNHSKFAADEYFHHSVLGITDGLHSIGTIQWPMLAALFVSWLIVFGVLMKGVKSLGKFSYFTSTLPYLVLLTLLIKASMEPGARDGILFYFTPDFSKLGTAQIWNDAATQIFYSSGACFGCGITLASYNNRDHNVLRDAVILSFGNSFTSVFSGSVVFSILGFMAHSQNTTVAEVVTSGPGLTFIAYPQAVTLLTASPVWSTLFFFMLSLLALSSMFPMVENVISGIQDQYKAQLQDMKLWVTAGVCFVSFLLGISIAAEGGMYVLQLFDTYAVGKSLLFIGFAEVTVVAWRYGASRLVSNLESMVGRHRGLLLFKVLWVAVAPALIFFAIFFSLAQETPAEYGEYVFEPWGVAVGWLLTLTAVLPIPAYAAYKLISFKRMAGPSVSLWECVKLTSSPSEEVRDSFWNAQAMIEIPGKVALDTQQD